MADPHTIRAGLKRVLREFAPRGPGFFQMTPILREVAQLEGIRGRPDDERLLLDAWYGLFEEKLIQWGHNLDNPGPPFIHLTENGREWIK